MSQTVTPAEVTPAHGLPVVPPAPRPPAPYPRGKFVTRPDAVEFTAACPTCGDDADWRQTRDGQRVLSSVHCPRCGHRRKPSA